MKRKTTLNLVLCALFAGLSAALSQAALPMIPVPVVLTQVSVFMAAGLLGWKWGTLSQLLFVAMGAAGLPVFSGFKGGPAHLFGPTGGFIFGYILAALAAGLLFERFGRTRRAALPILLLGALLIYFAGIPWLMYAGHLTFTKALSAGMLPFLPGDIIKAALCWLLLPKLYPLLKKVM
ncbi:MAG: biotin transporter BioY [Oscillospiraceae bacterium]|nr:biotin transporter BioY [Oscillospiraceae bacterium]